MASVDLGSGIGAALQSYVTERDYQAKTKFLEDLETRKQQDEEKWKQQDEDYRQKALQSQNVETRMTDAGNGKYNIETYDKLNPSKVIDSTPATSMQVQNAQLGIDKQKADIAQSTGLAGMYTANIEKTGVEIQAARAAVPYAGITAAATAHKEEAYAHMLTGKGDMYDTSNPTKIKVQDMKNNAKNPAGLDPDSYLSALQKDPVTSKVFKQYTDPNGEYAMPVDEALKVMKQVILEAGQQAVKTGKPVDPRALIPDALKKRALEIQKLPTIPDTSGQ